MSGIGSELDSLPPTPGVRAPSVSAASSGSAARVRIDRLVRRSGGIRPGAGCGSGIGGFRSYVTRPAADRSSVGSTSGGRTGQDVVLRSAVGHDLQRIAAGRRRGLGHLAHAVLLCVQRTWHIPTHRIVHHPALRASVGERLEPRQHRDPDFLAAKQARLGEPHLTAINELVRQIAATTGSVVPTADPDGGGVRARVLILLETPSRAGGYRTAIVSIDNDDSAAANLWRALAATGLDRRHVLVWNAVPWYVGTPRQDPRASAGRDPRRPDLAAALGRPAAGTVSDHLPRPGGCVGRIAGPLRARGWGSGDHGSATSESASLQPFQRCRSRTDRGGTHRDCEPGLTTSVRMMNYSP